MTQTTTVSRIDSYLDSIRKAAKKDYGARYAIWCMRGPENKNTPHLEPGPHLLVDSEAVEVRAAIDAIIASEPVSALAPSLERLVDTSNVFTVLQALEQLCRDKAEHIREHWQDKTTAQSWDHDARIIATAARRVRC